MKICASFVDKLWEACQDGVPTSSGCTPKLSTLYTGADAQRAWTESDITEFQGLGGTYITDNIGCFDAGVSLRASLALLMSAAVMVTLFL